MSSLLFVIDLNENCTMYHVGVKGITTDIVKLGEFAEKVPVLRIPEDFFHSWFLWNLGNDKEFRQRIRRILKVKDQLTIVKICPPCLTVDKTR